jgi:hypothetical protein
MNELNTLLGQLNKSIDEVGKAINDLEFYDAMESNDRVKMEELFPHLSDDFRKGLDLMAKTAFTIVRLKDRNNNKIKLKGRIITYGKPKSRYSDRARRKRPITTN